MKHSIASSYAQPKLNKLQVRFNSAKFIMSKLRLITGALLTPTEEMMTTTDWTP